MWTSYRNWTLCIGCVMSFGLVGWLWFAHSDQQVIQKILAAHQKQAALKPLKILNPADNTVFPPDLAPPTLVWEDEGASVDTWLVQVMFTDQASPLHVLAQQPSWTPTPAQWTAIRQHSVKTPAKVDIIGFQCDHPGMPKSTGHVTLHTSRDPVAAPIFYREVNLPFVDAVKDPSKIRWRFGTVSSLDKPPVVLENLPVCGNCHSFSQDGRTLGMDVDYANSKGSYVLTQTAETMNLATTDIITWNDFKKEDKRQTFGLLSQVSPDGNLTISTVKDRSIFVPAPDLAFSQLFFPIQGILAVYNRQTEEYRELPGASDPNYVQSNPVWSPDGQTVIFARTKAYRLKNSSSHSVLLSEEECAEFLQKKKPFKYDLFRVSYNEGQGGTPEPLIGASRNGKSNYFPRFSPDGQWIVFCQSQNYMLLQPDSELYVIPTQGGEARRLECNTSRMNSWHSFSPDGKWLVFSSKALSDYTQLFLTHFDENGRTTPAVLLDRFTSADRAANIPEFVNLPPDAIRHINETFLDDYSYVRIGDQFFRGNDMDQAIVNYRKALSLNPKSVRAHVKLGYLLNHVKNQPAQGIVHARQAVALDPGHVPGLFELGYALLLEGKADESIQYLAKAAQLAPEGLNKQYSALRLHQSLGIAYQRTKRFSDAARSLKMAVTHAPQDAQLRYTLATALAASGDIQNTITQCQAALALNPAIDTSPALHQQLATNYAKADRLSEAITEAEKALKIALTTGQTNQVLGCEQQLQQYRNPAQGN